MPFSKDRELGTPRRTITFAERVGYQLKIEDVYWRHRIWPEENPKPKPPLEVVISRAQLEKKVERYLRKAQSVADQRGLPITSSELQAEMDRMANNTKRPEVLRELFAALGNDPLVVAECLARPILAERLATELDKYSAVESFAPNDWALAAFSAPTSQEYKIPKIVNDCSDDSWAAMSAAGVPDGRFQHTTIWTGSEMIVWGGFNSVGRLNTGGRYDPSTDSWAATSLVNSPAPRTLHVAVWAGNEMIVWGGEGNGSPREINTGGRYNPITDSWVATSTANTPSAREQHTAVWTGNEMIVWGGRDDFTWFNSGGRYDPSRDSWTAITTINAPGARWYHTAAWTGSEMIVWGGTNQTIYLNTGGRYNPATDSWTPTGLVNAPLGKIAHTSIWSGSEMMVWGGVDSAFNDCNTGDRYNPTTDSWTATALNNAPSPRDTLAAVWTASEMIIWGGIFCCPPVDFNSGGRYNPDTDSWITTSAASAPLAREWHTAVWTGSNMIVWGGYNHAQNLYLNTGGIYCAQPSIPIVQSAVSQKTHGNAGGFGVNLPLTGMPGIECRSGGATDDYTMVVTFLANVSVNGNPQAAVTWGTGMVGSGGVSNGGTVMIAGNVVTVPLTNVANAQTINVTLYGVNDSTNVVIPMSILIGDTNGNGTVNASDVSQAKSQVGTPVNGVNFREDVNHDGVINATDVAQVKVNVGTSLPP